MHSKFIPNLNSYQTFTLNSLIKRTNLNSKRQESLHLLLTEEQNWFTLSLDLHVTELIHTEYLHVTELVHTESLHVTELVQTESLHLLLTEEQNWFT